MILGIAINPYAMNVPNGFLKTGKRLGITIRKIDLPSLRIKIQNDGKTFVTDHEGPIVIDSLAPYLLFGFSAAVPGIRLLGEKAYLQNPVDNVLIAYDQSSTSVKLAKKKIPQVLTHICSETFESVLSAAEEIGYPVVIKRSHGSEGRWVRRAENKTDLKQAFDELMTEGPGTLLVQPQILEAKGRALRILLTGGKILATTERTATGDEWRSNTALGATERAVNLTDEEKKIVVASVKAVGLLHAGVDLLRTKKGPIILEINACPDYTVMMPYFKKDLGAIILKASLKKV